MRDRLSKTRMGELVNNQASYMLSGIMQVFAVLAAQNRHNLYGIHCRSYESASGQRHVCRQSKQACQQESWLFTGIDFSSDAHRYWRCGQLRCCQAQWLYAGAAGSESRHNDAAASCSRCFVI